MIARALSSTLLGIDARIVEVEAELSMGLPNFSVIGLGGTSVQEARYRIQSALRASGVTLPHKRITINLAPASLRKEGSGLDLPMALSLLAAIGAISEGSLDGTLAIGELALCGRLRPVRGILSAAALASKKKLARIIVPMENGAEAQAVPGVQVVAAESIPALLAHLRGEAALAGRPIETKPLEPESAATLDLREVRGQGVARRALEIAAAGGHNLFLVGSPGSGKTMLARRLPSILPPLSPKEQLEVTQIWSVAGLTIGRKGLLSDRPFRAPHHTISEIGLIGGGHPIRPGEISLAHHGVLFLDEMPEAPRRVLDSLRQPLEDHAISIVRSRQSVKLPASFMLVGAANPCPCGWRGHASRRCCCSAEDVRRYISRISGPLMDRMDLIVEAPLVSADEILSNKEEESSRVVRERVISARAWALPRRGVINARLSGEQVRGSTALEGAARELLRSVVERLELSARSIDRTLRVARTISDLEGSEKLSREAIAEALCYRGACVLGRG